MRRQIVFIIFVFSLLLNLNFMQKVNILTVKAFPDVYQGDLMLNGNNVTIIEGTFDINGSILVEENATLNLRNALLTFVQTTNNQFNLTRQNPSNGNPRLVTTTLR